MRSVADGTGRGGATSGQVLVVNAGSSSLKLRLLGPQGGQPLWSASHGAVDPGDGAGLAALFEETFTQVEAFGGMAAAGHRFVHGGPRLRAPVALDDAVEAELRGRVSLAPQHLPVALALVDAARAVAPDLPQVACFDTAFHATLPAAAFTYAIPAAWRDTHGIRRYGFHGLSHAHAARRATELLGVTAGDGGPRIVTCHLGSGASLAAVAGGVCVDTTMGFTPLEGLVMGTRAGTVDPGALLWLQREAGLSVFEVADGLEHHSGLRGLAGSADMRDVLAAAGEPGAKVEPGIRAEPGAAGATGETAGAGSQEAARLALEVYLHRLRSQIGAMTAALGGLDALVFTGGVGEAAPQIRAGALAGLGFLGLHLDPVSNAAHSVGGGALDVEIGHPDGQVRIFVVEAREDLEIARAVRALLAR